MFQHLNGYKTYTIYDPSTWQTYEGLPTLNFCLRILLQDLHKIKLSTKYMQISNIV